ncbi:hypothetical protein CEQ90_15860 [Lewinellaceae bacterium SD302]|nr:hypothetical protein CEQ90_15860 [Lewinellaceae bacterium SD302]
MGLLAGQNQYSGIYQPTEAQMDYREAKGWEAFLTDNESMNAKGYRLIDVESSQVGGDERIYYGVYTESSLKDSLGISLGWEDFVAMKRKMAAAEYTMVDVHAFALNEFDTKYIGVWVDEENDHKIAKMTSREGLDRRIKNMGRARYKLKRVHVLSTPDGEPEYIALFHYSPVQEYNFLHYTESMEDFMREFNERIISKTRLVDYATFWENGKKYHLGVYQNGDYDYRFLRNADKKVLDAEGDKLKEAKGLSLFNMNVY